MFNGILRLAAAAVCAACIVIPASAEQLYSWTDENGVTHYSSLPPTNIETKKAYETIDTTFTPSEREANKKFREEQKQNSADAAAAEENKKLWVQRCKDLANDKVRFSERRINDTYFANVSKCVDSSLGDTDEIKEQRRQCIMKAKQQRDKEFADLPSPEDCEAASAGTDQEKPEAESGKEAPKVAKSAKAAKSPRKK